MAYLEAFGSTKDPFYEKVVREILTYITRDMTDKDGGFYSAEDADSEGVEGKFYVWRTDEILTLLGVDDAQQFMSLFNMSEKGNFRDEATRKPSDKNILFLQKDMKTLATNYSMEEEELTEFIHYSGSVLFDDREKRIHPLKDDKILTDWNGLMIAAMAKAGTVLGDQDYVNRAKKAMDFILKNIRNDDGTLLKRFRNGKAGLPGHLDDYAFLSWGLIELYEATFETRFLKEAVELSEQMVTDFWDQVNGGFFLGKLGDEELIIRAKTGYDGAIPSGNSVAAMCLLRLGRMTGDSKWLDYSESIFKVFSRSISTTPRGFTQLLSAYLFQTSNPIEFVIVGNLEEKETSIAIEKIRSQYNPNRVLILKNPNDKSLSNLAPWTQTQIQVEGKTTFYVCENFSCKQPTTNINTALGLLDE